MKTITIATRCSQLALWQAHWVADQLRALHPELEVKFLEMTTKGDKILDKSLAKIGGKGLFVKELETALLDGRADLAVHSMKDMPMDLPEGLALPVITEREDPRDILILNNIFNATKSSDDMPLSSFEDGGLGCDDARIGESESANWVKGVSDNLAGEQVILELPSGSVIGTSSLRRACQLLALRKDLVVKQLRGNVNTRLAKLAKGEYDAIILATAGVKRLGMDLSRGHYFSQNAFIPAAGQGAIGIECRGDDQALLDLLKPLHHGITAQTVLAERAVMRRLQASCQVPVAAYAVIKNVDSGSEGFGFADAQKSSGSDVQLSGDADKMSGKRLVLSGLVGRHDGSQIIYSQIEGDPANCEKLGLALAEDLLSQGAGEILELYAE